MSIIFISYGREDWELASRLYGDLKTHGLEPWIDQEDLLPGQNWKSTNKNVMRGSEYILALFSSRTVDKRGYVQTEVRDALELLREFPNSKIFLIPVRIDECKPSHEMIKELHRIDLFPDYSSGLAKLLMSFRKIEIKDKVSKSNQISLTLPSHQDVLSGLGKEERYVRQKLGSPDEVTEFNPPCWTGFVTPSKCSRKEC